MILVAKHIADPSNSAPVDFRSKSFQFLGYSAASFRYDFDRTLDNVPSSAILGKIIELLSGGYSTNPFDLIEDFSQCQSSLRAIAQTTRWAGLFDLFTQRRMQAIARSHVGGKPEFIL
jgi:hypothetical protein